MSVFYPLKQRKVYTGSYDSEHKELLEKIGSDDEGPIDVKPKAEKYLPYHPNPYLKTWRVSMTQKKEYYFLRPKTQTDIKPKDNIKDIIKIKPTYKANPSIN